MKVPSLNRALGILVSLFFALSTHWLVAANANNAFEEANKLYEQGKFKEAAESYEKLLGGAGSATLYYNLGNAWFKAGQNGKAIVAYRQAQQFTPRDPNLRFNLEFVRKKVTGFESARRPFWQRWLGDLTLNEWTVLAACAYWVWLIFLALREFRPALKRTLRGYTLTAGIIAVLLVGCMGAAALERARRVEAVVVVPNAVVRHGPLTASQVSYQAPDGSELVVLDQQPGTPPWFQVQDASGRRGWVTSDQVELLRKLPSKPQER